MYNLYIGSNNETKELEIDKIKSIIGSKFAGFSLIDVLGCWNGNSEKSVMASITTDDKQGVNDIISKLKADLQQEAIGVQEVQDIKFI